MNNLAEAVAALEIAATAGHPVTLQSPPGGARSLGVLYFREMVALARARVPEADCDWLLDCGDEPGIALHALRHGAGVILRGPAFGDVADIARQFGRRIEQGPLQEG